MRALLATILVVAACGTKEPAPPAPGTGPTPTTPTAPAAPAGSGTGTASSAPADCATLNARFDDVLAHAPGTCATAADCECYPGGLGANPTCGGVTDKRTAAALSAIRDDVARAQCPMPIQCAASLCAPRCDHGRCR